VFSWLRKRLAHRTAQRRGQEHFAAAEGSLAERYCVVSLMMAIEDEKVVQQLDRLPPRDELPFMMGYECCMMWAIKTGLEGTLEPEKVQAALGAMKRHLETHGWFEPSAFEKIWSRTQIVMPIAMNIGSGPNAPPPFPIAEMQVVLEQAGYPLTQIMATELEFGIYMAIMMTELKKTAQSVTRN
jgi:hypothetical protein